jgi:hypothetical protein
VAPGGRFAATGLRAHGGIRRGQIHEFHGRRPGAPTPSEMPSLRWLQRLPISQGKPFGQVLQDLGAIIAAAKESRPPLLGPLNVARTCTGIGSFAGRTLPNFLI